MAVGGDWWRLVSLCLAPFAENSKATKGNQQTKPKMDTSGAKVNRVWRRKCSFGIGKVHFGTEREPTNTPQKITSVSPCFRGLKSENCGRQAANKNLTRVVPLQGFLNGPIPIGKRPEKHQQKFTSVSPSFKVLKSENCGRQAANKKLASVSPLQGC